MAVMAALAGRTRRMKFGMNDVSIALRDPGFVATQCATVDVLSDGRLLPAFGGGSPAGPENGARSGHAHAGTRDRREVGDRAASLGEDNVDFRGVHYRLSGVSISPKPVQTDLPM